jgi:hypothetical protein
VRIAADAIIQSWQLEPPARERLFQRAARRIAYYQDRNALARACHTRTALRRLHRLGITLKNLPRCDQDTS